MKSYLKILKVLRAYWLFLAFAVALSLLISVIQPVSLLSVMPFWSKIAQGDPFNPQISIPLAPSLQGRIDAFANWINGLPNQRLLYYLLSFIVVIYTLRGIFMYMSDITLQFIGNSVVRAARSRLYEHMQTLSVDYFTGQRTGELMSRITFDAEQLHNGVSEGFEMLLRSVFDIVGFVIIPVIIDWKLTLIVFGLFFLVMPPIIVIGNKIRKLSAHSQERIADLNSMLQETITGVRVVKAFSMEEYEKKRFNHHNNRFYRLMMSMARRDALISPVTELVVVLVTACVVLVMGKALLQGRVDGGIFIIYLASLAAIPRPIKLIGRANNKIQRSTAAIERMDEILKMETTVVEKANARVLPPITRSVRFIDVGFSYNGKEPVLEGINLEARRCEIIAVVGASGAGKSTLVNMIPRFYDPTAGRIEIDGIDVQEVTLKSLRDQIGIVTQEILLFNDTVARNIAYGKKETPREKIIEAARTANAYEFISALPHGFDTVIGERGYTISGGERQRIALARAILKDSPILILDEATSALDAESESLVQDALNRLMSHRTVFVIAHRLSTIRHADRIIVLDDRKIIQEGKHDDLLAQGGPYKRLYDMQFNL